MIYLVYDYEEHGPTNLVATTDYMSISAAIDKHFDKVAAQRSGIPEFIQRYREAAHEAFIGINILEAGEHALGRGWGGTILEIVDDFHSG
jgi:hypothetical protein